MKLNKLVFIATVIFCVSGRAATRLQTYDSDLLKGLPPIPHMLGPKSEKKYKFPKLSEAPVIFINRVSIRNKDRRKDLKNLCHVFLKDSKSATEKSAKNKKIKTLTRWGLHFVLGMNQRKVEFPKGFGVPVRQGDEFEFIASIASHGSHQGHSRHHEKKEIEERYTLEVEYSDNPKTQPLYRVSVTTLIPISQDHCVYGKKGLGGSCRRFSRISSELDMIDQFDQGFSPHFYVPQGKHTIETEVTHLLNLQNPSTVHYVGSHIHPGVESLTLYEGENRKKIFQIKGSSLHGEAQQTETFSSGEGIDIHANRSYYLVAEVENTSKHPIDIMASLHLYLKDNNFSSVIVNKGKKK